MQFYVTGTNWLWKIENFSRKRRCIFGISLIQYREFLWNFDVQADFSNRIERHQIKMNSRNLVTSLSQQLDTSCTEFPDGFEETQQIQVSFADFFLPLFEYLNILRPKFGEFI